MVSCGISVYGSPREVLKNAQLWSGFEATPDIQNNNLQQI